MSTEGSSEGPANKSSPAFNSQLYALMVELMNAVRQASEGHALEVQRDCLAQALSVMVTVKEFIGTPEEILGNAATKHGEIAEVVEVGMRNAFDYVSQQDPTAALADSRIAREDILLNGVEVQMKTVNGVNNGLRHVLEHMKKYDGFGRDESHYLIPKDQLETIRRVLSGDTSGLKKATVDAIKSNVEEIERLSGKPFEEVVRTSSTTYAEVQQGAVLGKLDEVEEELHEKNDARERDIIEEHAPSVGGALKAAAGGAAVGAAFGFAGSSANKYFNEGKNLFRGDFDSEDWKEVGLDTAKGAAVGGVSVGSIYVLTNFVSTSAPVAGAFVGAARGISALIPSYIASELSPEEFVDQALFLCTDVSITTMFAVAGQAVIPVPIVGALVGSIAGKFVSNVIGSTAKDLQDALAKRLEENITGLTAEHRQALNALQEELLPKSQLAEFAFATENNVKCIWLSSHLARMHGVPERLILKDESDVLAFLQAPPSGPQVV